MEVAHAQSGSSFTRLLVELEFRNVGFREEGKSGVDNLSKQRREPIWRCQRISWFCKFEILWSHASPLFFSVSQRFTRTSVHKHDNLRLRVLSVLFFSSGKQEKKDRLIAGYNQEAPGKLGQGETSRACASALVTNPSLASAGGSDKGVNVLPIWTLAESDSAGRVTLLPWETFRHETGPNTSWITLP